MGSRCAVWIRASRVTEGVRQRTRTESRSMLPKPISHPPPDLLRGASRARRTCRPPTYKAPSGVSTTLTAASFTRMSSRRIRLRHIGRQAISNEARTHCSAASCSGRSATSESITRLPVNRLKSTFSISACSRLLCSIHFSSPQRIPDGRSRKNRVKRTSSTPSVAAQRCRRNTAASLEISVEIRPVPEAFI